MSHRLTAINKTFLTILTLLLVSGQLSAYPIFCTMSGMEMHSIDSQIAADASPSKNMEGTGYTTSATGENLPSSSHGVNNCELVCGACLSYSQPGARLSYLLHDQGVSPQGNIYSRFAPSQPPQSLFRPPISA
ncbi:MAG: hypothetical protein RKH07_13095 [Gammaproteobacteria bacterium]